MSELINSQFNIIKAYLEILEDRNNWQIYNNSQLDTVIYSWKNSNKKMGNVAPLAILHKLHKEIDYLEKNFKNIEKS